MYVVNRNDRAITILVMIAHGMVHTYEMTVPLFVVIWLLEFDVISLGFFSIDVTTASIGVVVTLGYALFGLGALPGGVLVDRVGSRRLISVCLFGMGLSYLLLGLAPNMLIIAIALIVWGASASVYHPSGLSLVSKGVSQRGTGFAYHGMAGNLGIGLGPLISAILMLVIDWRTVAIILSIPAFIASVYATRARFDETAAVDGDSPDPSDSKADTGVQSLGEFLGESKRLFVGSFVLVFAIVICSGLYYRGILTFLPELLRNLPGFNPIPLAAILPNSLETLLGINGTNQPMLNPQDYFYSGLLIIGIVGQYIGGKLTDRFRVEYGIAAAFAVLCLLALVFVPVSTLGFGPLLAVGLLLGIFLFLVQPLYQATVAEYTPPGTRGLSYGYTYLGVFGVGSLGGGIAGAILAFATVQTLFFTLAAFALTASLTGLYLARTTT